MRRGFHRELLDSAAQYHRRATEQEVAQEHNYQSWLRKNGQKDRALLAESTFGFLFEWGEMDRAFPRNGRDKVRKNLEQWLWAHASEIGRLRKVRLSNINVKRDAYELCALFDSLRWLPQRRGGKHLTYGPTAAGKTLHFLLPDLCCIWDAAIVRKHLGLDGDAWSYLRYVEAQQFILRQALDAINRLENLSNDRAETRLRTEHYRAWRNSDKGAYKEPAVKILDEAVFDPVFRRSYMKPAVDKTTYGPL